MNTTYPQTSHTKNTILAEQALFQPALSTAGGPIVAPTPSVSGKDPSSAIITTSGVQHLAVKGQHSAAQKNSEASQMFSHCADNTTACCSSAQVSHS